MTTHQTVRTPGKLTVMPSEDTRALGDVEVALTSHARLVDEHGNDTPIPQEVHDVLREVVEAMQAGRAIVITPTDTRLTTGEAASYLGISRPTLVKLLEEGKIPFEKPNRHRYVLLTDLTEYSRRSHEEAVNILDSMSRTASEDGLYDITLETFDEALTEVKRAS